MIRKAQYWDIPLVANIYEHILDQDASGVGTTGWIRGVYPTEQTALEALEKGELFVLEENGHVVAAAKINREQVPEYANCPWAYDAPAEQIMVLLPWWWIQVRRERGMEGPLCSSMRNTQKNQGVGYCGWIRMQSIRQPEPCMANWGTVRLGLLPVCSMGSPMYTWYAWKKNWRRSSDSGYILKIVSRCALMETCENFCYIWCDTDQMFRIFVFKFILIWYMCMRK